MTGGLILDTSVLSALAPGRQEALTLVGEQLRSSAGSNYFSVITISEIQQGIEKLRRAGGVERADKLSVWLTTLVAVYGNRVLQIDNEIAFESGILSDKATAIGKHPGMPDILIAATAKMRDLTLSTRNGRHFEPLGIQWQDPFDVGK